MNNVNTDYVLVRAGGEILCLPVDEVNRWSTSQKKWANLPRMSGADAKYDAIAQLMWDRFYCVKYGHDLLKPLRKLSPRFVSRFQYWLRTELLRWGLI